MPANAHVAQTAENVLDDTQYRQDGHGVSQVEENGHKDANRAQRQQRAGDEDAQADRQHGTHGAELDLAFLGPAGEGQHVKERQPEQQLNGEQRRVFEDGPGHSGGQRFRTARLAAGAKPPVESNGQGGTHDQDQADANRSGPNQPQQNESQPQQGAAGQRIPEDIPQRRVMDQVGADNGAREDAGVDLGWAVQQQEEEEDKEPALDAVALASLAAPVITMTSSNPSKMGPLKRSRALAADPSVASWLICRAA